MHHRVVVGILQVIEPGLTIHRFGVIALGVQVIVGGASLVDVDERAAAVLDALDNKLSEILSVERVAARDEGVTAGQTQQDRIDRVHDRFFRHGFGFLSLGDGRGGLALGQRVDVVVEHAVGDVEVAPAAVDEVARANAVGVAVAAHADHGQVVVGELQRCHGRHHAAVQRVERVGVHVMRRLARATNAADHRGAVRRDLQLGQRHLHGGQDAEVPAPGTPVVVDLRLVVGRFVNLQFACERGHC